MPTVAGTLLGDLICTNFVTVNPRPTASLVTAQTICNGQSSLVLLQTELDWSESVDCDVV